MGGMSFLLQVHLVRGFCEARDGKFTVEFIIHMHGSARVYIIKQVSVCCVMIFNGRAYCLSDEGVTRRACQQLATVWLPTRKAQLAQASRHNAHRTDDGW